MLRVALLSGLLFVLTLGTHAGSEAHASSLVANPDFDNGLDDWSAALFGNVRAELDGSTGSPTAPSAHLFGDSGTGLALISSCVSVTEGTSVDLEVDTRGNSGFTSVSFTAYGDDACGTIIDTFSSEAFGPHGWGTMEIRNVVLPEGTHSANVSLNASTGSLGSPPDANFDHVEFGVSGAISPNVDVNQEGLSGTWYNPATSGQGMQFAFSPDVNHTGGLMFGAWYTFDVANGDHGTRWYSIQGPIAGDQDSLGVAIFENVGGNFDAPPATTASVVGTGMIRFDSCESGSFDYAFDDGRFGNVPLRRLLPNVSCTEAGPPDDSASDFGLSGTWYNPDTSGQGLLVEVNPVDAQVFVGWYTYALAGASYGAAGERWFSAQTPYTVGTTVFNLTLYASHGGIFDSPIGVVTTSAVGTATLEFTSCTSATFSYAFVSGPNAGRSGTISLVRLGATPSSCTMP